MKGYLIILCIAIPAVSPSDYCSMSCYSVPHFGCNPKGFRNYNCPQDARLENIDRSLQQVLIDAHNEKRNLIAGGGDRNHLPACRMGTMAWDDELAYLASLNVQQCAMRHDMCHKTNAFENSGQNLYISGQTSNAFNAAEELKKAVGAWYNEVQYSSQHNIDKFPQTSWEKYGHFTVMMADRNIRLGCAASIYTAEYTYYLVACNYATTNMVGQPIYTKCNRAGEKCETGPNSQYPNLCSEREHYNVNDFSTQENQISQHNIPQHNMPQYNMPQYNMPQYNMRQYNRPQYNRPQYNQYRW